MIESYEQKHAEPNDVDCKDPREKLKSILDPAAAVIIVLAVGAWGIPTQIGLPNASIDAMVDADRTFVDQVAAIVT